MPPAITVEAIGKRYMLGERRGPRRPAVRAPDGRAGGAVPRPGRADRRDLEPRTPTSSSGRCATSRSTIEPGEVVGLIGPNGAGKSTLLKLMARITAPTTGRIVLRGRVGTLLEVGTGFHPELTGRENVFLNGSILGLTRREIAARFDEIVDFAEVERFIDTPVKRYSSGMYVRLAFAVAAHLEPEILLVDEVLASATRSSSASASGRCAPPPPAAGPWCSSATAWRPCESLCSHAYLIESGRLVDARPQRRRRAPLPRRAQSAGARGGGRDPERHTARGQRPGALPPRRGPRCERASGRARSTSASRSTLTATVEVFETIPDAVVEFGLSTPDAIRVASMHNIDEGRPTARLEPGLHEIRAELDVALIPGEYALDLALSRRFRGETVDLVDRVVRVQALPTGADGAEQYPFAKPRGSIRPRSDWNVIPTDAISSYPARG